MGILEKIVDGLKVILRLIWWALRVYLSGHLTRVIQQISALKKIFVSYLSIIWIMPHWIQATKRILTITWITWITCFLFISFLDQFCLYFPKSSVNGIACKHKWQKFETFLCNQTHKWFVWMAAPIIYTMAWSVGSPKFICLCINFLHYLNQRISDQFFQTNSP